MDKLQTLGDVLTLVVAVFGAILIPYLILRAWVFPHARTIWTYIVRSYTFLHNYFMSSGGAGTDENEPVAEHSQQLASEANQAIVMQSNAITNELTINAGDAGAVNHSSDFIPAEAREVIRFQAKAEAIAELLRAGLVTNQAKAIETVYHVSRTSSKRPDTPYQKAKQLIESLINPRPLFYDDLRAKVEAEVKAERDAVEV